MNIYNMTPHPITIVGEDNNVIEVIPCSGWELRLSAQQESVKVIGDIHITKTVFGPLLSVKNRNYNEQPNPWSNINLSKDLFIVSQVVKNAHKDSVLYNNLLVPTEMVRIDGEIVGCRSLGV